MFDEVDFRVGRKLVVQSAVEGEERRHLVLFIVSVHVLAGDDGGLETFLLLHGVEGLERERVKVLHLLAVDRR